MGLGDATKAVFIAVDKAYEVAQASKNADMLLAIAELKMKLAEVRIQAADLQEENLNLRERLNSAMAKPNLKAKLQVRDGAYYFLEKNDAHPAMGPFCTVCMDSRGEVVLMSDVPPDFHELAGKFECKLCKQSKKSR